MARHLFLFLLLTLGTGAAAEEDYLPVRSRGVRKIASAGEYPPPYMIRGRAFPRRDRENYALSLSLSQNFSIASENMGSASMPRQGLMQAMGLMAPMPPEEPEGPPPGGGAPPKPPEEPAGMGQPMLMGQTSTMLAASGVFLPHRKFALSLGANAMIPWEQESSTNPQRMQGPPPPPGPGGPGGMQPPQPPEPPQGPTSTMVSLTAGVGVSPVRSVRLNGSIRQQLTESSTQSPNSSLQMPGPPGIMSERTAVMAGLDWNITRNVGLSLNGTWGFEKGAFDPTAAIRLQVPLYEESEDSFVVAGGVQASAPVSAESQEQGKITTITGLVSPTFRSGDFSVSFLSMASFSSYGESSSSPQSMRFASAPAQPQMPQPPGPDLVTTMNQLSLGLRFSDEWSASSAGSVTYSEGLDGNVSFSSQMTLLGLSYSPGEFTLGAAFSLVSSASQEAEMSFPNQPNVGISLRYTFGSPMALRMGANPGGPR